MDIGATGVDDCVVLELEEGMPRIRFAHAADLHLDSPFKGLRAAAPGHVADALCEATLTAVEPPEVIAIE